MREINEIQIIVLQNLMRGQELYLSDMTAHLNESMPKEQWREVAFYLAELENEGYIRIPKDAYSVGGAIHPVYQNNVSLIWLEKLILMPKGKAAINNGLFGYFNE